MIGYPWNTIMAIVSLICLIKLDEILIVKKYEEYQPF